MGRRARWITLPLLAAAPLLILLSAERSWREALPHSGLSLADDSAQAVVTRVEPGGPAEAAGVRPGDRILQIAGQPVGSRLVAEDLLAHARPGRAIGLLAVAPGADLPRPLRLKIGTDRVWYPERLAGGLVSLVFLLGALLVLLRPRGSPADGVYAAWCLAGALVLGVSWSQQAQRLDWVIFWVDRSARLLLPALWLHLVLALVGRTGRARSWLPVIYAPAIALLLVEIHLVGLGGALRSADPVGLVDSVQSRLELGYLAGALIAGLFLLVPAAASGGRTLEQLRLRWVLAGTAAGTLPFLAFSAIPQAVAGAEPSWSWVTIFALGLVPLAFTGAVLDYRLMDLALFARRLGTLVCGLGFTLVLFLGVLSVVRMLPDRIVDPAGLAPALIAALITTALTPTIRAVVRDLVGRVSYRRRYNFRRELERVARDLNAERDLPRLSDLLERRVTDALDAGTVQLLLCEPDGRLTSPSDPDRTCDRLPLDLRSRAARGETIVLADVPPAPLLLPELHARQVQVLVPLRVEGRLIALLAVGPRPHASLLDSDDMHLLRSVAAHAAAAVAGAQHLAELRTQMALVERLQARTQSLVASSPIGIAVVDLDGNVSHWNPALERLLAIHAAQALGRAYESVLPAVVAARVRDVLESAEPRSPARTYRMRVRFAGGREKLVDLAATPLRGPTGDEGLLLTLDDVTERAQMEEKLIQQDRLASIGFLAAGVAHEVNTPLTGISSYAQMLLEETLPGDPRRSMLEKIVQQAHRASRIARDLLRFSRPQADAGRAHGPVDLRELVEDAVGLLALQIRQAGATVETHWNGAPLVVTGDSSRLQQVVMNLLLNALDAVRGGGNVWVRGGVTTGMHDEEFLRLEIEDDGVGIPEHARSRIFDPFFTTKKAGEGSGLGLSISYAIVREHGGVLTAESEAGRGTVMRLLLPAAQRLLQPARSSASRAS